MKEKIIRQSEGKKLNVLGDSQIIKLSGQDTNGQFAIIVQDNPPNASIPKHIHTNEDELFSVIEGEVEFEVGEQITILKSGDIIFLPRNIPHSFKVVGTQNAKTTATVTPAGLEKMFEELSVLPVGPPDFSKVAQIGGNYGLTFI
jgi:quercetin dioxygenase-like cupin family protein